MLETFTFDIIIIIVFLYSIAIGYFRGFYKQLLAFLALAIPMIVVRLLHVKVTNILSNIKIFETITTYLYKIGRHFLNITLEHVQSLLITSLIFIISFIVVQAIIKLFIDSKKRDVAKRKIFTTRIIGVLLGIFQGCIILHIILILIAPLIPNIGTSPLINTVDYFIIKFYRFIPSL